MRFFILFIFINLIIIAPVQLPARPMPLLNTGGQVEVFPGFHENSFEFESHLEIFYRYQFLYLRADVQSQGVAPVDVKYIFQTGYAFTTGWFIGGGVELAPGSLRKTETTPAVEILKESEALAGFFRFYLDGRYSWGAVVRSRSVVDLEFLTQYEFSQKPAFYLRLSVLPVETFKAGFSYEPFGNLTGLFVALNGQRLAGSLEVAHNFSTHNDTYVKIQARYVFNTAVKP